MWKVQLFKLNYDDREVSAVAETVKSGWLTMGEKTEKFESNFGLFLGSGVRATAVSSGTAALHMSLLSLGIAPGDEVIIPSLSFVADINTVKLVGATPVLADCTSLTDWNIDPIEIERKITSRTKAIMIVHYAGYPCDMEAILSLCKLHGLKLIEDCAHAPGATFKGKSVGTFGDFGCFSFFSNKNLSVGEGGMVTTVSEKNNDALKLLRSHGMTSLTLDRHKGRAISYDVVRPGFNFRIDEVRAALGLVQLAKLEQANHQRSRIVDRYIEALHDIDDLIIPFSEEVRDVKPAYHIFTVLLPKCCDRLSVIEELKRQGVQSSIHYPAFQEFSAFVDTKLGETPIANEISKRELTLPLYPTMNDEELDTVTSAFHKAIFVNQ